MQVFLKSILLLGLFSFANATQAQKEVDYSTLTIPAELKENATEVVRLEYQKFIIKSPKSATIHVKRVVTLLNSKSSEHFQVVGYDPHSKINDLSAKIYDAFGKEVRKIKGKEFNDQSSISGSIYEDDRIKYIELHHSSYPFTIEFEYKKTFKGLRFYPSGYLQDIEKSVENFTFIVETPADLDIRHKSLNIDLKPNIEQQDGKKTFTWVANDLPALEEEPLAPYSGKVRPEIKIVMTRFQFDDHKGDMSSWKSFGKFMYELNKGRDELSPEMTQTIKDLTANAQSDQEKIEILYQYLQDNMRYVSVQLGIGGWQTFDAEYVEKNKYGDCKALSNFMKSMLKEAGIKAYSSIIYSSRDDKIEIDDSFTFPDFANHVILNVPSENMWLECTSTSYPPNYIGSSNSDRPALLITEKGGKVVRTPTFSLDENKQSSTATININGEGAASIKKHTTYIGPQHDYYRYLSNNFSQEEIEKKFLQNIDLPAFSIEHLSISNDKDLPRSVLDYDLSVARYASTAGKRIFIPLNKLNPFEYVPKAIEKRKHPVHVKSEYREEDSFTYYLPGDYELESLPEENILLESEFGKYQVDITLTKGSIIYKRLLEIRAVKLPAERYNELRDFYKEIAKADGIKVVLVKKKT